MRQRRRKADVKKGKVGASGVMQVAASYVGKTENNNRAPWLDALALKYVGRWMVGQPWCGLFCIVVLGQGRQEAAAGGRLHPEHRELGEARPALQRRVAVQRPRLATWSCSTSPAARPSLTMSRSPAAPPAAESFRPWKAIPSPGSGGTQGNGGGV